MRGLQLYDLHARARARTTGSADYAPETVSNSELCSFTSLSGHVKVICLLVGWPLRRNHRSMSAFVTSTVLLCTTPRPKPNGVGPRHSRNSHCGVVSSLSYGITGEITGPSVVPGCFMYVEKARALCNAASGTRSHHILMYCVTMQETGKRHKVLKLPPTTTGLQVVGLGMTHAYRLQLTSVTQASASSPRTCCRASSL